MTAGKPAAPRTPLPRLSLPSAVYVVLAFFIGAPRQARAQQAPIEFAYEADLGCPTAMEMRDKVRQRAGVDLAPATRTPAPVRIQLRASGQEFLGRLEMQSVRGAYVRELAGASCEETASALAFVLAQALLPEELPSEAGEEPQPLGPVERTRTVIPPTVVDRPRAPLGSPSSRIVWWAGAYGGVRKVPLPSLAPMFGGFVDWRLPARGAFEPSLGLGFVFSAPTSLTTSEYAADVAWLAGRLSMCPARLGLGPHVAIVPCIGGHAGVVWASGTPLTGRGAEGSSALPWFDGLAEVRVEVQPTDSLSIRLGVEAIAIFSQYELVFDNPNTLVFQMPSATVAGSLGVVLRVW